MRQVFKISVNIYAEDEQEALQAQKVLGQFVNDMGHLGIAVTGKKIAEAVPRWQQNAYVKSRIIDHFK